MALDGLKISNLIISESQTLLEVFDHLFDLPPFGVVFDDIDGSQMNIRTDKVSGFLTFFFHHHDGHFPQALNVSNKPGDAECFGFSIHEKRNLSIGRNEIQKTCDVRFFPMNPENRIGLDRKSTRLNSSHGYISYAVFCLKKKHKGTTRAKRSSVEGA